MLKNATARTASIKQVKPRTHRVTFRRGGVVIRAFDVVGYHHAERYADEWEKSGRIRGFVGPINPL